MTQLHNERYIPLLQAFSLPPLPEACSMAELQHAALLQGLWLLQIPPVPVLPPPRQSLVLLSHWCWGHPLSLHEYQALSNGLSMLAV